MASKRAACFKFVACDNAAALKVFLADIPSRLWASWVNDADQSLLELSVERRSYESHVILTTTLGIPQNDSMRTQKRRRRTPTPFARMCSTGVHQQLEEENLEEIFATASCLLRLEEARAKAEDTAEKWRAQKEAAMVEELEEEEADAEKAKACRLFRLSLRAQEEASAIAEEAAERWRAQERAKVRAAHTEETW